MSARIEKRDVADQATEITTESIFDMIKSGIKNTFSDDNISVRLHIILSTKCRINLIE